MRTTWLFIRKHKILIVGALWLLVIAALAISIREQPKLTTTTERAFSAKPSWQQDFTKMSDGRPDPAYWTYNINPLTPTYNEELQAYTNAAENARIQDGVLRIEARAQNYTYPGTTNTKQYAYTSARLDLRAQNEYFGTNSKAFAYGKLVARLKLPEGVGTWPAFWLLSDTQPHTKALKPTASDWNEASFYKHDGELDIIEGYGLPDGSITTEATMHTYAGPKFGTSTPTPVDDPSQTFHDYGIEITPDSIRFTLDGKAYATHTKQSGDPDAWPFTKNNNMYAILNLAIGGKNNPKPTTAGPWYLDAQSVSFYAYIGN